MTNSIYISYHAFNWGICKNKFVKSILKEGGDIEMEKKENGKYLVKVSNPSHNMNKHPRWQESSILFWKSNFKSAIFNQ